MPRSHQTILVVDDNQAARYSTARALRAAGFATVESAGGAEALELARQGVAAVVLDVHLPDLHGFEVCRLLRGQAATAALPVIHVSAVHVRPEDHASGLGAGADAYLVSPVDPIVLVATLEALIQSRSEQAGLRAGDLRFRGVFENLPCAVALVDAGGAIVDANPALARLLGYERSQLAGRLVSSMAPADWRARAEQALAAWKAGPWQGPLPLLDARAARVLLEWKVAPHVEPGLVIAVAQEAPASR